MPLPSSQMKHTPTPWRIARRASTRILAGDDDTVATTGHQSDMRDAWQANAAHIVRCVNSHDQLVEALRQLLADVECYCAEATAVKSPCGHCMARAALKLAEES